MGWVPVEAQLGRGLKDDIQIPFSSTDGGAASALGTHGRHISGQRCYTVLCKCQAHGVHKMQAPGGRVWLRSGAGLNLEAQLSVVSLVMTSKATEQRDSPKRVWAGACN